MTLRRATTPPREQFSLFDSTVPLRSESAFEDLPATARELVEVIGIDATIDLVKMFGGDDVKIPEIANGASRMWAVLVETVGPAAAHKLVNRYAGTTVYVAMCAKALRVLRDREIIRRFDSGEQFDTIRREHKITRRHLYRILKKPL
jgi:hypothetical protein